jgi:hypothetical protein
MGDTVVSVERVIEAPAADIFAIVADASTTLARPAEMTERPAGMSRPGRRP